uniref:Uncharacterized protein n=1 Tax=Theileria annulata TaxID=5874 RepID=A0A3B0MRZ8_THEAN
MLIFRFFINKFVLIYLLNVITHCSPDIAKLEDDQRILIDSLKRSKDFKHELDQNFNFLDKNNDNKSLNSFSSTIPVENEANVTMFETNYSPPIIVLLPEDSSSREKWEYAVTLKCLGQKNFDAFTNIHNTRMAKMASISGTTVKEIGEEIKETEQELQKFRKELEEVTEKEKEVGTVGKNDYAKKTRRLHIEHNIKLLKQEIHVMEVKLDRLNKRLKSAILFGNKSENTENSENYNENDEQSDVMENEEGGRDNEDENGDEGNDEEYDEEN